MRLSKGAIATTLVDDDDDDDDEDDIQLVAKPLIWSFVVFLCH